MEKPLFIPLRTEYFEAFSLGYKAYELRPYGKRWNEKTCRPGRAVTLSKGYGKHARLSGVIDKIVIHNPASLNDHDRTALLLCYGNIDFNVIKIFIKITGQINGNV